MKSGQLIFIKDVSGRLSDYLNEESLLNIPDFETLHRQITIVVVGLLLNDMEKLLQLLYRIDVNEQKLKQAFTRIQPELIAPEIAGLMIERELQKAESRHQYR